MKLTKEGKHFCITSRPVYLYEFFVFIEDVVALTSWVTAHSDTSRVYILNLLKVKQLRKCDCRK